MNAQEVEIFQHRGKEMIDYVSKYLESMRTRDVAPNVENGYLVRLLPDCAPEEPDKWEDVMNDVDKAIIPGHTSPAGTELEVITMDWLAKLLKLPKEFLHGSIGGGVIMGGASETTLMCMMTARQRAINKQLKMAINPPSVHAIWEKLVVYTSDQAHSSVFRAGLFAGVEVKAVVSDNNCSMHGQSLEDAIADDRNKGRIPFMVVATLGTTSSMGFDNLTIIGPICEREGLWLHVDAAYAGSAFICPEYRPLLNGVEYANTFNFNPHKWLMVHIECSALWVKNTDDFTATFRVDPPYLNHHKKPENEMPEFRHWQIDLSRGFRSLKLWFVLRLYGAKQLRENIRKQIRFAKMFDDLVKTDDRFEVVYKTVMGVVSFRLKKSNEANDKLVKKLNAERRIHLTPSMVKGQTIIRFVVCSPYTNPTDILLAWNLIKAKADDDEPDTIAK